MERKLKWRTPRRSAIGRICPRPRRSPGEWFTSDGIHSQSLLHDRHAADPAGNPVSHGSFVCFERASHTNVDQVEQKFAGRSEQHITTEHLVHAGDAKPHKTSRSASMARFSDGRSRRSDQPARNCNAANQLNSTLSNQVS